MNLNSQLQPHQILLSKYMLKNDSVLLYHMAGSGKTRVSLAIANELSKKNYNIFVILPASLINNYKDEIKLSGYNITFNIYSFHSFVNNINNKFINSFKNKNILIIIDEAHNLLSEDGLFYKTIKEFLDTIQPLKLKLVLMTATPIVDNPLELTQLFNLFKRKNNINSILDLTNNELKKLISTYVSFFKGPPDNTMPKSNIFIVKCKMQSHQLEEYKTFSHDFSSFYIKLRTLSNFYITYDNNYFKNIKKYSTKLDYMFNNFDLNYKIFVYSNFRNEYGIETIKNYLNFNQWKNYLECTKNERENKKILKYAIWSSLETYKEKQLIKKVFNNNDNIKGYNIKLILGSPSSKEGLSFKAVHQVHIFEPYWNWSRMYQIMSRAIRFHSHIDLKEKERVVDTFIYLSSLEENKVYKMNDEINNNDELSVDEYIWNLILKKKKINNKYESLLRKYAFDSNV